MLLSSRRSTPIFRTITAFDWDVAPLPRWTQRAGILHSDAYCMTSRLGRARTRRGTFIEFALGPRASAIVAETRPHGARR